MKPVQVFYTSSTFRGTVQEEWCNLLILVRPTGLEPVTPRSVVCVTTFYTVLSIAMRLDNTLG